MGTPDIMNVYLFTRVNGDKRNFSGYRFRAKISSPIVIFLFRPIRNEKKWCTRYTRTMYDARARMWVCVSTMTTTTPSPQRVGVRMTVPTRGAHTLDGKKPWFVPGNHGDCGTTCWFYYVVLAYYIEAGESVFVKGRRTFVGRDRRRENTRGRREKDYAIASCPRIKGAAASRLVNFCVRQTTKLTITEAEDSVNDAKRINLLFNLKGANWRTISLLARVYNVCARPRASIKRIHFHGSAFYARARVYLSEYCLL